MPADLWLLAGILAFHLYDSALRVHVDELLAWPRRRGWAATTGGEVQWRGGYLFVPSPWTPWRPLLRLSWMREAAPSPAAALARVQALRAALRPLQVGVGMMALLLFGALPVLLLAWRHAVGLLALVGAVYLLSAAMVVYLVRRRDALGLSRGALWSIAADTLACPPFALNVVRKVSLRQALDVDGLAFATATLPQGALRRLRAPLLARLALMREFADADNARLAVLASRHARLLEIADADG
ncbi:hypothetical protein P6166_15070 [Stenotrophomonas sp. HITSZ_GD]|uniref:hypothetical protein n=1 Tax=Stenotrophomonas sp. HITSZ_GD TaxID=3037248 RepID=UPI00240DECD1|nr:hypothetical protein [Stenotrophomonas sp. HITSZ_GD]MDG2526676.1 hypothetical protein [Stenotrophomonas sp. HITSZ_GD]